MPAGIDIATGGPLGLESDGEFVGGGESDDGEPDVPVGVDVGGPLTPGVWVDVSVAQLVSVGAASTDST
jgi:hypothetical protein